MVPGSKPTVYQTGFTTITGLAFGPDKSMYVTELTTNTRSQKPSGAVIKVAPDGARTTLGQGTLFSPSGAVFDRSGNLYVSNFSVLPATTPKKGPYGGRGGQVVRFPAS